MSTRQTFTKENLDNYLNELAKDFRKRAGRKAPAEIILIGGASVLVNYGFRDMTYDMDAIINASSAMKEAVNHVGDVFGLPNGWLNADFMKTRSYTPKLAEHSVYYKTFSNILTVRSVASEYLVAMKLMAGRKYKHDLSDIIGILREHQLKSQPITREQINTAVTNLYGNWDSIPEDSRKFIDAALESGDYESLYQRYQVEESNSKEALVEFEKQYPGVTNESNVDEILKAARMRKHSQ